MTEKYNSWTNHETWNVTLWLPTSYWHGRAQEIFDSAEAGDVFNKSRDAQYTLTDEMKDKIADKERPELDGLYGDLLTVALRNVNWSEIANSLFGEVSGYEETT